MSRASFSSFFAPSYGLMANTIATWIAAVNKGQLYVSTENCLK